jgi:predicted membrane channel-forming protein YqfA (hemolysin III family)
MTGGAEQAHHASQASARYTPPTPEYAKHSPPWLPVLMFVLLGLGAVVILFYYLGFVPGGRSYWYVVTGLALIMGGLFTATKWH